MAAAPDPNEVLRSTSGKSNFQRVTRLLISGGTTLLREVFDQLCPPSNLPTILKNPATEKQLKAAKLTKPQWDCLYPSPGVYGKSTDFDVTLLFRLLRNICNLVPPTTGWDVLPTSTDHSLAADLARIKYYRNAVYGHVKQEMEITDDKFPQLWKEISDALIRIAGQISPTKKHGWHVAIINFLKNPLTAADGKNVHELLEWYRNDMEVKESIEEVQSGMERLNTTVLEKSQDIKDQLGGELKSATQEVQCLKKAVREGAQDIKDQLGREMKSTTQEVQCLGKTVREEAQDIKDQLDEVKHRLSAGSAEVPGAVELQVKIDCKTILPRVGASEMFVASQGSQSGSQETAVVPIASGQLQTEVSGGFEIASSGNHGLPSPQGVLSLIAFKYFQFIEPSNPEEFNGYLQYLKEIREVLILGTRLGSLIITVECRSLEILEGLWNDYCTGRLNEMAQKYLVTEDVLKEFGLAEVKLTTTILEEEYKACREHFMRYQSARLPRPETSNNSKESDPELTSGGIQVLAKETLTGKELSFNVLPSTTIREVKNKILEKVEIPLEELRLFCAGKLLMDDCTLIDYNFHRESALHLAVVHRGAAMQIHVKTPNGETITLTVSPEDTILQVKRNLANKAAIPVNRQQLTFDDKELGDVLTLSNYNIQKESVLHLARRPRTMPIKIRRLQRAAIALDVFPHNTIGEVKAMIAEKEEIPPTQQQLSFIGMHLEDNHTLSDYYIKFDDVLDLVQRIG